MRAIAFFGSGRLRASYGSLLLPTALPPLIPLRCACNRSAPASHDAEDACCVLSAYNRTAPASHDAEDVCCGSLYVCSFRLLMSKLAAESPAISCSLVCVRLLADVRLDAESLFGLR